MATVVCQGIESQLCEPRTALRLKLSSQPLDFAFKSCLFGSNPKHIQDKCPSSPLKKSNNHSLSFLEAITTSNRIDDETENRDQKPVYVHPLSKRSVSSLSEKSLQLCTENLGSETGTDIIEDDGIFLSKDFTSFEEEENSGFVVKKSIRSRSSSSSFPPPLTTMTGMESVQVRTHREDGRLILKAVKAPSPHSLFHAERSHGRLRLTMFKDSSYSVFDSDKTEQEEPGELEEEEEEEMSIDDDDDIDEDDATNQELVIEDEQVVVEEEEEDEEAKENTKEEEYEDEDDVKGNRIEVEGKMGIMKKYYRRRGRCMEEETTSSSSSGGEIGISIWEPNIKPVWVATS